MSVLLITGPPASGKNTIGELIARQRGECAAIDVDQLRQMLPRPAKNPWPGNASQLQQELAVRNASSIARNFNVAGFDAVISDVLTDASLDLYKSELSNIALFTVLLLPSEDEISARMLSRPDYLSRGEMSPLYDQQAKFAGYDERLDNTDLSPDEATSWILQEWSKSSS